MIDTLLGHVRVVDYDSPMLPPRAFQMSETAPLDWRQRVCGAIIDRPDVPVSDEQNSLVRNTITGFVCTRTKHDTAEIHVSHFHQHNDRPSPAFAVVWGGE